MTYKFYEVYFKNAPGKGSKMKFKKGYLALLFSLAGCCIAGAQNPVIRDQFTADPTARVFNGKVYLFPSHDISPATNKNKENWFSMADYHVFSSENLTNWKDHGVILSQDKVPWVKPESFSMWAPDCVEKNGKYYFYFPSTPKDSVGKGFAIGVAIASHPEGPYKPLPMPIEKVHGIDPNVLIDKNGDAYLYWSSDKVYGAKLKSNMTGLATEPQAFDELPAKGHKEGPFVFEREGRYYLTYPHVANKTERLEYAIGTSPLGPFKVMGVIMDESPSGTWTNHHSIIEYKKQWYLFYHDNDLSPKFDKNRSVRIDSLRFNKDGTIQKVIPTYRGVGITLATHQIDIDRYSAISKTGVVISFLDTANAFGGWKAILKNKDTYIKYNTVDFGKKKLKSVRLKMQSEKPSKFELRIDSASGPLLAVITTIPSKEWSVQKYALSKYFQGLHHIVLLKKDNTPVAVDWLTFE